MDESRYASMNVLLEQLLSLPNRSQRSMSGTNRHLQTPGNLADSQSTEARAPSEIALVAMNTTGSMNCSFETDTLSIEHPSLRPFAVGILNAKNAKLRRGPQRGGRVCCLSMRHQRLLAIKGMRWRFHPAIPKKPLPASGSLDTLAPLILGHP